MSPTSVLLTGWRGHRQCVDGNNYQFVGRSKLGTCSLF